MNERSNPMDDDEKRRAQWIHDARRMIDFVEARPALIPLWQELRVGVSCVSPDELAVAVRLLGTSEKGVDDYGVTVKRRFGHHTIEVYASHVNVCERVVTGTRIVEKPDPTAPMVTVTEEIVEWRCPPSLLAGDRA